MSLYHFFMRHAGYAYNPATQTPLQGRRECAKQLSKAVTRAISEGYSYEWSLDGYDSSEWSDDANPWATWQCVMHHPDGGIVQSLCGIDFGRDGSPWGDPYRRVVEAELACEEFAK